tara:strand:+ start:5202 stop:6056 length:855 start_codon:yes stop_codon:yes gene_type:complete
MKNKLFFLTLLIIAILSNSCEDDFATVPDENLVVVQAYIYAGQPVKDIKLMSTLALDDENTVATPIDSAEVTLLRASEKFKLEPTHNYDTTDTDTTYSVTYFYPDSNLVVNQGDTFRLEINYMDQVITSETVVPSKPDSFFTSVDTLWVPEFNRNIDYVRWIFADSNRIQLYWDNPDDLYHYLLMDNVELDPQPLEKQAPPRFKSFISQPFIDTTYTILASNITHFGHHDIVLFHVKTDYVLLYQSSGQDTRDLNEPYSNINGGLGIFSAFNSDTASIYLIKKE